MTKGLHSFVKGHLTEGVCREYIPFSGDILYRGYVRIIFPYSLLTTTNATSWFYVPVWFDKEPWRLGDGCAA